MIQHYKPSHNYHSASCGKMTLEYKTTYRKVTCVDCITKVIEKLEKDICFLRNNRDRLMVASENQAASESHSL